MEPKFVWVPSFPPHCTVSEEILKPLLRLSFPRELHFCCLSSISASLFQEERMPNLLSWDTSWGQRCGNHRGTTFIPIFKSKWTFLLCVCAFLCVCMCSWVCMHSSLGTWNNRQLLTLGWFPPHHDWPSLVNLVCSLSWDQSKGKLRAAQFISESISCLTHGWLFYSHEHMSVFECPMSPKSTCQFYSGFYIV